MIKKKMSIRHVVQEVAINLGSMVLLTLVAGLVYILFISPWHRQWGTQANESGQTLPGDEIVPHPEYFCTHAITIHAPAQEVWPWLVQLGQNRAGFYSYTWIENIFGLDMHNADRIVPEWQVLEKGDQIMLTRSSGMVVEMIEKNRYIVFDMPMEKKTIWSFYLQPLDSVNSRLRVHTRMKVREKSSLGAILFDPGHFIMERRTMSVIKERAEQATGIESSFYFREGLWGISLLVGMMMIVYVFFLSRQRPWNLVFSCVLMVLWQLLMFCWYASILASILLVLGSLLAPKAVSYINDLTVKQCKEGHE